MSLELTIALLIELIKNRNIHGYQSTINNFLFEISKYEKRYSNMKISKSAFSQSRKKLSYQVLEEMNREYVKNEVVNNRRNLWKGLNIFAVDGSMLTLPDDEKLTNKFKKPGNKNGTEAYMPKATIVALLNLNSMQVSEFQIGNCDISEKELFLKILPKIEKNSLIIADRFYGSRTFFHEFESRGLFYLTRVKAGNMAQAEVKAFVQSKKLTAIIELEVAKEASIKHRVRLVRGPIDKKGSRIVFATNLLDKKRYHRKELIQLYRRRWEIETYFNRIKNIINIEHFHSRSFNEIMQEIYVGLFYFNVTARSITLTYNYKNLLKFKNLSWRIALNALGRYIGSFIIIKFKKIQFLEFLILSMVNEIYHSKFEPRNGRSYPRFSKQPQDYWTKSSVRTAAKAIFNLN